jgi:hypothetical protein
MDDNVKVPVTPDKQPRTYDRSKCVICLEDIPLSMLLKKHVSISEAKVLKDLSNIVDSSLPDIFSMFSLTL